MAVSCALLLILNYSLVTAGTIILDTTDGIEVLQSSTSADLQIGRTKRAIPITQTVAQYAATLEASPGHVTNTPTHPSSIYQYTYKTVTKAGATVKLPLVVRATVKASNIPTTPRNDNTDEAIAARDNCVLMGMNTNIPGNNDEYGHLVAHNNGGPYAFYNIVPQTKRMLIRRGTVSKSEFNAPSIWYGGELAITSFLERKPRGRVELTIVVLYDRNETRPAAFGVAETWYLGLSGGIAGPIRDRFYSNDPTEDPDVLNG